MSRKKRKEPKRDRTRTQQTVSSGPVRVAIVSTPSATGDASGALRHELDLAKSALLYADEVEMVSLSISMIDGIRMASTGDDGFIDLLGSLGPELLAHLGGANLPKDWTKTLRQAMSFDPNVVALLDQDSADELRAIQEEMKRLTADAQSDVDAVLESTGASELAPAVKSGVLKVANLAGVTPASTLRPAELGGMEEADVQMWTWLGQVIQRLNDPRIRVLLDEQVGDLVQSMIDEGIIEAKSSNLRLAAQASAGSGFVSRLPAFPQARMDELLDLREDLAPHLIRYRSAITRLSNDMPSKLGRDLEFDVQQVWDADIQPELLNIEEQLASHGLVKELAKAVQATDIRSFGTWTAGTWVALDRGTDLSNIGTGLAAAAATAAPRIGQALLDSARAKAAAKGDAKKSEFYLLYEANRRLDDLRQ